MNNLKTAFVLTLFTTTLFACSSMELNEDDPKSIYEVASKDIENDRYQLALDRFRMLKNKFSYTSYGALAQLRIADIYFLQDSFPEAAAAYETFSDLHPKHDQVSYAIFRAGESHFNDIPSNTERDLRSAESAIQSFQNYLTRFPTGEHVAKANEMKKIAYDRLAEKELEIANFYFRRDKMDAALIRFKNVFEKYPDSPSAIIAKEKIQSIPNGATSR